MGVQENVEVKEDVGAQQATHKGFLDEIFDKIRDQLKDISYVEVITATGAPEQKIDSQKEDVLDALSALEILARTRIELDGDMIMVLPTTKVNGQLSINQEILNIHKQNVDAAVQNWKSFMDTILNAVRLIASLAGLGDVDIRNKLGISVAAPQSATGGQ